jgi:hypothetical protein
LPVLADDNLLPRRFGAMTRFATRKSVPSIRAITLFPFGSDRVKPKCANQRVKLQTC